MSENELGYKYRINVNGIDRSCMLKLEELGEIVTKILELVPDAEVVITKDTYASFSPNGIDSFICNTVPSCGGYKDILADHISTFS